MSVISAAHSSRAKSNHSSEAVVRAVRSLDPIEGKRGTAGENPPWRIEWLLRHPATRDERRGGWRIVLTVRSSDVHGTCPMDPRRAGTSVAEVGEGLRARRASDIPGAWRHGGHSQFISVAVGGFATEAAAQKALSSAATVLYPEQARAIADEERRKVELRKMLEQERKAAEELLLLLPGIASEARRHGWQAHISEPFVHVYGGAELDNIPPDEIPPESGEWRTRGDGNWWRIVATPIVESQSRTLPPWLKDPARLWQDRLVRDATRLGWELSFRGSPKTATVHTFPNEEYGSPYRKWFTTHDSGLTWGESADSVSLSWEDVLNIRTPKVLPPAPPAGATALSALMSKYKKNPKYIASDNGFFSNYMSGKDTSAMTTQQKAKGAAVGVATTAVTRTAGKAIAKRMAARAAAGVAVKAGAASSGIGVFVTGGMMVADAAPEAWAVTKETLAVPGQISRKVREAKGVGGKLRAAASGSGKAFVDLNMAPLRVGAASIFGSGTVKMAREAAGEAMATRRAKQNGVGAVVFKRAGQGLLQKGGKAAAQKGVLVGLQKGGKAAAQKGVLVGLQSAARQAPKFTAAVGSILKEAGKVVGIGAGVVGVSALAVQGVAGQIRGRPAADKQAPSPAANRNPRESLLTKEIALPYIRAALSDPDHLGFAHEESDRYFVHELARAGLLKVVTDTFSSTFYTVTPEGKALAEAPVPLTAQQQAEKSKKIEDAWEAKAGERAAAEFARATAATKAIAALPTNAKIQANVAEINKMLKTMPSDWKSQLGTNRAELKAAGADSSQLPPAVPSAHDVLLSLNLNNRGDVSSEAAAGQEPASGHTVPDDVRDAAMEGVRLSYKNNYGGYNFIGLGRAIQLAISPKISSAALNRMRMYFDRKTKQDRLSEQYVDKHGKRYWSWLNWGGDPGARWSGSKRFAELVQQGAAPAPTLKGSKKSTSRRNPKPFQAGDRVFRIKDGKRRLCAVLPDSEQGRNPDWRMVQDLTTGTWVPVPVSLLEDVGPLEELALSSKKKTFLEAKHEILQSLAGLPPSQRLDGKCLLANTTLCGLAGGRLAVGTANHREVGPVLHVWVVDSRGRVQDALDAYYSRHQEDPSRALELGDAWQAAHDTVHDVASGTDAIGYWRRYRGV